MSETEYIIKGKTDRIAVTSRASVKANDSYYTVEYHEERTLPTDDPTVNLSAEREALWDVCNTECDKQIEDILTTFKK